MSRAELQARAAVVIEAIVRGPHQRIAPHLASLQPLEAMALLGMLVDDTIARFPPGQRADIRAAFVEALEAADDA